MEQFRLKDIKKELTPLVKRAPKYARLIKVLSTDAHLSAAQRTSLRTALGYLNMPIDLIPDNIPVLGRVDDMLAGFLAVNSVLRTLEPERVEEVLKECDLSPQIIDKDQEILRKISKNIAETTVRKSTNIVGKITSDWQKAFSKAAKEFKREYNQ